ncbi:bifunctional UDP-N-acetylglucosamine diphosphorylase/glucosamine-1-phosphate N-acetyltransferase GlmU [Aminivibrio sp.]
MTCSTAGTGALVLAAGKGTRMKSDHPKVLLPILDQPLLYYVLSALEPCRGTGRGKISSVSAVVGHKGEEVSAYLSGSWPSVIPLWQHEQLGTGHAVRIAREWWSGFDNLMVLPGDVPHLQSSTLEALLADHAGSGADCTFLSFSAADPRGYGRVVRSGPAVSIVEDRDATEEQKLISEVNSGIYIFTVSALRPFIDRLDNENAQGEYYLPDLVGLMVRDGRPVNSTIASREAEFRGVNTPEHLWSSGESIRREIVEGHLSRGVRMMDPSSVWIGPAVTIEPDVSIDPFVQIWGKTAIARGSHVGAFSILRNMTLSEGADVVSHAVLSDSRLERGSRAGPFIVLRDGAVLGEDALAGKFVEIKKSVLGKRSKAPHLTYLGDASVGEDTNIGAGTITCNYDGQRKNPTTIGNRCFIGSDTMLVAPVEIEDDAFTAAGSVISRTVPEGALGVARAHQKNIDGWSSRRQKRESKEQ